MKKEIAKKWIAALRSGHYQQGKGKLTKRDGSYQRYCCLGVLCEVALAEGLLLEKTEATDMDGAQYVKYNGDGEYLPRLVKEWAGMESKNGQYTNYAIITNLSSLVDKNDSGLFFDDIADLIDVHWKEL